MSANRKILVTGATGYIGGRLVPRLIESGAFQTEDADGGSRLTQAAVFAPRGLLGRLYWWAMFPFHVAIFRRMAKRIAATAEGRSTPRGG